jgi:DNA-binding CsgD family transcriptional regulator/tetratricopeptide (TPR) repeat protein
MGQRRSSVFVGRVGELDRLQDFVADAFAGDAALFLVGGPAGAGKSRLVEELAGRVRASGARVSVGCCLDFGEVGLPYAPFREALRDLAGQVESQVEGGASGVVVRAVDQAHYFEQVMRVLASAASSDPLLVVLEDLHWADTSTGNLLTFLARNLHRAPIALVATFRTESMQNHSALRQLITGLQRRGARRLDVTDLTAAEVKTLAESLTGERVPASVVESLARRSGGNAFFIEELVAAGVPAGPGLPDSLRDLLLSTIDPLPGRVRDVLQLLAVSGQQTRFALLERVAGEVGLSTPAELEVVLDAAADAGIVASHSHRLRFRHDLLRGAVTGKVPPGHHRRVHRALGLALEAAPTLADLGPAAVAGQLAYHWDEAGEADRCLVFSLAAARAAAAANAPAEAAAHYRKVVNLWPLVDGPAALTGADRATVLRAAATSLQHLGSFDEAARMCQQAVAEIDITGSPTSRALAREQLAQLLWSRDDEDGALALYSEAAALVEDEPPSPRKAAVIAAHARSLMLSDHYQEAIPRSHEAIQLAVAAADRATQAAATITLGAALIAGAGRLAEGVELLLQGLAIAREVEDLDQLERAVFNLSWPLIQLGRAEQAIDLLQEGIAAAAERGRVDTVAFLRTDLAYELTGAGRLGEAEALLHGVDAPEEGTNLILFRMAKTVLALARGDIPNAVAQVEDALNESSTSSSPHTRGTLVHAAVVAALAGDIPLARERIDSARRQIAERDDVSEQADTAAVAVVIESLAARHDPRATLPASRTTSLLTEMRTAFEEAGMGGPPTPAQLAAGSLAEAEAAFTLNRPDPQLWAEAAQAREGIGSALLGGYARLRQAETMLATGGARDEAARLVAPVRDLAEHSGAPWLVRMADQLATRARLNLAQARTRANPAHPAARYGLTPRECEVLTHLAAGHTNRQIAADLFISEKTAGVHVSNLMRKLGVTNRIAAAEIGRRLSQGPN